MGAFDPRLKSLLATGAHQRAARRTGGHAAPVPSVPEQVGVLVKFTGGAEDLRAAGLALTSVIGHARAAFSIATGRQYGGPYGDTFHWIARRKSAGTGEGSSGLKYDLARFEQGEDSWRLVCSP